MTRGFTTYIGVLGLAFAAGCSTGGEQAGGIEVGDNDLGVATIRIERAEEAGNHVVTLRGFSADDEELGSVRLTTGNIAGLAQWAPGEDDVGSEIIAAFAGSESRAVTREMQRITLHPSALRGTPALVGFLELPAVSSALEREAHIVVVAKSAQDATNESAYATMQCPASWLLTSPLAKQCCANIAGDYSWESTWFINPAGAVVWRDRNWNGPGNTCTGLFGESCSGASCYWGPNGFARATIYTPPSGYPYAHVYPGTGPGSWEWWCQYEFTSSPTTAGSYGNVTGTFPTGAGCPTTPGIKEDDGAGAWDY